MVYIKSWTRYQKEVEELYAAYPTKTRYNIKFRPVDGVLVLKVTNDIKCLKHKATSAIILNRFETLNSSLLKKMANLAPPPLAPLPSLTTDASAPQAGAEGSEPMAVDSAAAPGTPAAAGGKKKKGKGKKK